MATLLLRCPHCNARGLDYLVFEQVKQFTVLYCGVCGAIHGMVPSSAEGVCTPPANPSASAETKPSPLLPQSEPTFSPVKEAKATPPLCRNHHLPMQQKTIPPGHLEAGQLIWICPRFKECNQWEKVEETYQECCQGDLAAGPKDILT